VHIPPSQNLSPFSGEEVQEMHRPISSRHYQFPTRIISSRQNQKIPPAVNLVKDARSSPGWTGTLEWEMVAEGRSIRAPGRNSTTSLRSLQLP
jgi:hypothetical protein